MPRKSCVIYQKIGVKQSPRFSPSVALDGRWRGLRLQERRLAIGQCKTAGAWERRQRKSFRSGRKSLSENWGRGPRVPGRWGSDQIGAFATQDEPNRTLGSGTVYDISRGDGKSTRMAGKLKVGFGLVLGRDGQSLKNKKGFRGVGVERSKLNITYGTQKQAPFIYTKGRQGLGLLEGNTRGKAGRRRKT